MLGWILAVVVLLGASALLNLLSSSLAGYEEFPLHIGFVLLVTLVGAVLFPFWGWTSTAGVLGVVGAWSIAGALLERRSGPKHMVYHGMSPDPPRRSQTEDER